MRSMNGKVLALALPTILWTFLAPAFAQAQIGALQTECALGGTESDGSYQFVATCAGRAPSPDGRFAVVQRAYQEEQPPIELEDANGRTLATLPALSDDMPFLISWSPDSHWFFANHHVGSFVDVLQVFEMVEGIAVERPAVVDAAVAIARNRYPCLQPGMVLPNGARWIGENKVVLVTISRSDACSGDYGGQPGEWEPLWMIGDLTTGAIEPASIRVAADEGGLKIPEDGPYAGQ
jgi:hypothetical protein